MAEKKLPLRLTVEGEDNDTLSRAIDNYRNLKAGKKLFILELLEAGQILKECGLLDIVTSMDTLPSYRTGNQSARRAALLLELVNLSGGQLATPQVQHRIVEPKVTDEARNAAAEAKDEVKKTTLPKFGHS